MFVVKYYILIAVVKCEISWLFLVYNTIGSLFGLDTSVAF